MELDYTYFESDDGFFVGWFDDFPEDVTQGTTLADLEKMLADLYECLHLSKYHKRTKKPLLGQDYRHYKYRRNSPQEDIGAGRCLCRV